VLPGETSPHGDHQITSVTWNKKVTHILASASTDSTVAVWDLKSNRSIFDFCSDEGEDERQIEISWNPDIPT